MKTVKQTSEVGVIVARFQSPFLHEGHQEIIENVLNNHPRVVIILGLSPLKCTLNNPYDFSIRKAMIEERYKSVDILYLNDVGDNEIWSKNLDRLISQNIGPRSNVVLYGSRDSFINSYKGNYPTIELIPTKFISASEIRKRIGIKPKTTQDFREGMVYVVQNQYPSFKLTVDAAIIKKEMVGEKIINKFLFARKPNSKYFCFVGGFTDPLKDTSTEEALLREVKEETGLDVEGPQYIGTALIPDWRYVNEQDKIMTIFYLVGYNGGTPKANDDIEYVTWKDLNELNEDEVIKHHRGLLNMLKNYIKNLVS